MSADTKFCLQCGRELVQTTIDNEPRLACPDASCGFVFWIIRLNMI